jgi:ligand-binding sensor domain-containing protein
VESILQDKAGNMWFGIWAGPGNAGAYRYDGKIFTIFLPETPVGGVVEDKEGGIWLNSKRYNGQTFTDFSNKENAFKEQVVKSLKDKDGKLWFAARSPGLYRFNGKSFAWLSTKEGLPDARVTCIFQDKKGGFWIGSDIKFGMEKGGLYRYDGKTFTLVPQVYDLGMYSIWTAVEDKSGNIWFGGRGGKLCLYDGKTFTDFSGQLK